VNATAPDGDGPVTTVATWVVRPGKEREFARWAQEIDRAVAEFDGHLGGVRLHDARGMNHLIYQFDSASHLRAWEESPRRAELLRRGDRLSEERRTTVSGLDTWFDVPGPDASRRWKTFLLTWVAAYPTLLIFSTAVSLVAPDLPRPVMLAITSTILTALLTWVILPLLTREARPWLLRGARSDPTRRPGD
jgi:antibiotic biosynthesis monooxygenase (ABM) superfamily enzyme